VWAVGGGGPRMEEPQKTPEEEAADHLKQQEMVVKANGQAMKRALDQENRDDALKYAQQMLATLGPPPPTAPMLSPQMYYDLYNSCFDQLRFLEDYFLDEWRKGSSIFDLYELVQHTNQILPRLYLLVTVGSVYIRSKEAPAKDVLKDLVEMCRGVQHPLRGLFLRNYLSQLSKDKLPDTGSEYEGSGGTVKDSIDFTLQNFTEMNKLWVRMQHQGPIREKERREKERQELRILVGTNLVRLSQLDGVDLQLYTTVVLPRLLEQVVNCKDPIAQEYLMDCIIQVFPDEFHLRTLGDFLKTIESLHQNVKVENVLRSLMERIASYAAASGEPLPEEINGFSIFSEHVNGVIARESLGLEGVLGLQTSLTKFARSCYPDNLQYVDKALGNCVECLEGDEASDYGEQIVQLLSIPLGSGANVLQILSLENFPPLMNKLLPSKQREVAAQLCRALISTNATLDSPGVVEHLFMFIQPLIVEDPSDKADEDDEDEGQSAAASAEKEAEEQNLLARLIHLLRTDNLDVLYKLYNGTRKMFGQGGPERIKTTLPPLVMNAVRVAVQLKQAADAGDSPYSTSPKKVFQYCHQTCTELKKHGHSELALRLFLLCAQGAASAGFEPVVYEFFCQAFTIYEEEISDSRQQFATLSQSIGTLRALPAGGLEAENYDTLAKKCTMLANKLMKKQDSCKGLYLCSHLFWSADEGGMRDEKKIMECLKKSLKVADQCIQADPKYVLLFVDVLNEYIYFYENGVTEALKFLPALLQLINEYGAQEGVEARTKAFLANTKEYMKAQGGAFADLDL
jgi:vacuolar protein sorting-associated protein 35